MREIDPAMEALVARVAPYATEGSTPYDVLEYLIRTTPAARELLQLAHAGSLKGMHSDALVIVAIAADAIASAHPGIIPESDVLDLNNALRKLFLE